MLETQLATMTAILFVGRPDPRPQALITSNESYCVSFIRSTLYTIRGIASASEMILY